MVAVKFIVSDSVTQAPIAGAKVVMHKVVPPSGTTCVASQNGTKITSSKGTASFSYPTCSNPTCDLIGQWDISANGYLSSQGSFNQTCGNTDIINAVSLQAQTTPPTCTSTSPCSTNCPDGVCDKNQTCVNGICTDNTTTTDWTWLYIAIGVLVAAVVVIFLLL